MGKHRFYLSRDLTESEQLIWAAVFARVSFEYTHPTDSPCLSYQTAELAMQHANDTIATLRGMRNMYKAFQDGELENCYIAERNHP